MKIALLGGTGSFGMALGVRLREAGYDVVIGSRDAERARAAGAELGVDGATNEDAARAADLVVIATKADGAVETARALREAIGSTPVLSVAAELAFSKEGVLPTPEATSIAHKHGWVTVNGVINTIGDAGIIYTPGGNYIFVVFLYHPQQLIWDSASTLVAQLSQVVYNFYNLPQE